MTTYYILSPLDKICFHCPLPQCDETNPRCPYRQALAAGNVSRYKPALREVQVLDYLKKHPDEQHKMTDIASAIGIPYRSVLRVLRKLQDKNQVTHTGRRQTLRWTAKDSAPRTAGFTVSTLTSATN